MCCSPVGVNSLRAKGVVMLISVLISELQKRLEENGDLYVAFYGEENYYQYVKEAFVTNISINGERKTVIEID